MSLSLLVLAGSDAAADPLPDHAIRSAASITLEGRPPSAPDRDGDPDLGFGAGAILDPAPRAGVAATGDRRRMAQEQGLVFGLQSGETPGCVVLPGWQPPTLDCTVIAGSAFVQTVTAWAVYSDTGAAAPVRMAASPLPEGARLLAVTDAGETAAPVAGDGRVTGRLRFTPRADQARIAGEPWVVDFAVLAGASAGEPDAAPRMTIRTRLHVVALEADQRLAVAYAFADADGDGAWHEPEPGLAGREMRLTQADGSSMAAVSDAGGRVALIGRVTGGAAQLSIDIPPGWRATTPSQVGFRFPSLPWAVPFVRFGQREAAAPSSLQPRLTTGRGCLANGDDAVYRVGEALAVRVRVDGVAAAWVRLTVRPNGDAAAERVLVPGQTVGGEAWYRLEGIVGTPAGTRLLRLEAWRGDPGAGPPDAVVECDYRVLSEESPALELSASRLELPAVAVGGASSQALVLRNVGGAPLAVSSARPQGGSGSPFSVAAVDAPPFQLAPGEERVVRVVFQPLSEGRFDDFLLLASNDPDQPLSAVALAGETPGQARSLSASLAADRGCLETGQEPIYLVDDPMTVEYRVEGDGIGRPQVSLEIVDAAGTARLLWRGDVTPGASLRWSGRARPPAGEATLRLSADDDGLLATAQCRVRIVAPTVRLAGHVFRDDNGNGVWDGGPGNPAVPDAEPALAGRRVRLGGPERSSVETDATGAFGFDVGLPGEYRVEVDLPSGWRATTAAVERVRVYGFPGERPGALRFGQRPESAAPNASATPTAVEPTPIVPPTATPQGSDCVLRGAYRDLPLGQAIEMEHAPGCYRVWVPTRWGGRLRVWAGDGEVSLRRSGADVPLADPARSVTRMLEQDEHGWFEVIVRGASLGQGHAVEAELVQVGRAAVLPWNTWSWPLSPRAPGPRLFDVPGALTRFDARFGLGDRALAWERRYHRLDDAALWWGHGWGAALAAAVLEQPQPPAGSAWHQDELEGVAAAFFEAVPAPPLAWDWPALRPRPGVDPSDAFADDLHRLLVAQLRMRGAPLLADLRQEEGVASGGEIEVQPHVIHAYHSEFRQLNGASSAGQSSPVAVPDPAVRGSRVQVTTVFTANAVFHVAGASAGTPETTLKRQQEAVYSLHYAPWGEVLDSAAAAAAGQDWRSLQLLAGLQPPGGDLMLPRGMVDPRPAADAFTGGEEPRGENPAIDSARLRELGLRLREGLRWP